MRQFQVMFLLILGGMARVLAQGPLDPTSGPAPTMRSLDQIEPRTPISELPFTISEPGSYYVTGNLEAGGDGIVVESDNVTIDLMDHSLTGDGTGRGIAATDVDGVSIRNGSIVQFDAGIHFFNSSYGRVENISLSDHGDIGILLQGIGGNCHGHQIHDVTVSENGDAGIALESDLDGSVSGNIISAARLLNNGSNGLRILARNGEASGNIIRNGVVKGTTSFTGLDVLSQAGGNSSGNIIEHMLVLENAHSGLRLMAFDSDAVTSGNIVRNNRIARNGNQIPALSVQGLNGGQANGNLLENNMVQDNASFGVYFNTSIGGSSRGNLIRGSTISGNGTVGIRLFGDTEGTRVENNVVSDHPTGIEVNFTNAFVFKNTLLNNTTSITAGSGNIVGPVITGSGEISNVVNPWSNFAP